MANRLRRGSAAAAMVVALVGSFERLRKNAYRDLATNGPSWKICYGGANKVKPGDRNTLKQYKKSLRGRRE